MNFKEKFKKTLSILLIVSLVVGYSLPNISFAEGETTEAQQPADTSQTQIDNSATVENSATTSSDTGSNTINPTPTPTPDETNTEQTQTDVIPTPTSNVADATPESNLTDTTASDSSLTTEDPTPTPTPESGITATNSAEVSNSISSTSETGENSVTTENSETPTATESAINTGDAVSETSLQNTINTNSINSEVVYQTVNIFVEENGNINLSDPFTIAASAISENGDQPVINISVTSVNNYTYLSNDIVSTANTGINTINGGEAALINTGDAYSIVSLLNQVNFTIINSKLHIVTINIFGKLNGNIILPDVNASTLCDGCGISLSIDNNANLTNNVDSTAVTGQNSIEGSGTITTGNAQSSVNNINLVNTNLVGVNAQVLYITVFGTWDGNFIGWGNFGPQSGGASLVFIYLGPASGNGNGCATCSGTINIQNSAFVTNNVTSLANTGGNSINGNGTIQTGQSFSAVSLINLINTNFINSIGFFGFINIFGDWAGDIGGESNFKTQEEDNSSQSSGSGSSQGELTDGYLEVSQTNNAGEYILPGDTVTFFIKVKNPSNGDVHDTKLWLSLIKDGVNVGGAYFDLGNISPQKGVKVTTGLVLSKNAPAGIYTARAYAEGMTGENSNTVSSSADSMFTIFGALQNLIVQEAQASENPKGVLGNETVNKPNVPTATNYSSVQILFLALLLLLLYALLRKMRQNPNWAVLLVKKAKNKRRTGHLTKKPFKEGG